MCYSNKRRPFELPHARGTPNTATAARRWISVPKSTVWKDHHLVHLFAYATLERLTPTFCFKEYVFQVVRPFIERQTEEQNIIIEQLGVVHELGAKILAFGIIWRD